jgi:hypothetical protein
MIRNKPIRFFTLLGLTLALLLGMAGPALALESQGNVTVTGTYPARLEVRFPASPQNLPPIPFRPQGDWDYYYYGRVSVELVVTSNLPYSTTFVATDYSTGGLTLDHGFLRYDAYLGGGEGYRYTILAGIEYDAHVSGPGGVNVNHGYDADHDLMLGPFIGSPPPEPGEMYVVVTFTVTQAV